MSTMSDSLGVRIDEMAHAQAERREIIDDVISVSETLALLQQEMEHAYRCRQVWVMDMAWYKKIRRVADHSDEATWVPNPEDRMFGQPIVVRETGGKPHIEWMTKEEMAA